jgi:uncharacterized protein (TIGR02246 family)
MAARTPEDVDRLFGETINAGDLEGAVALYEPGATLVLPEGDVTGTAAIREALVPLLAAKLQLRMNVVKVVRAGDVAVLYNEFSGSATGPDGAKVEMQGKAMEVVRRQADGTWRFIVDDPYARGR